MHACQECTHPVWDSVTFISMSVLLHLGGPAEKLYSVFKSGNGPDCLAEFGIFAR